MNEIEKSLYNVAIANQAGSEHIRYHAFIDTQKDEDRFTPVSCCAGLGTRLFGSLPEFLYSVTPDGLYVDIYAGSQITWKGEAGQIVVTTETNQPTGGKVNIKITADSPTHMNLRLRMPSWATADIEIKVNGKREDIGTPGGYTTLGRTWSDGDEVSFVLPMGLRVTRYEGNDQVADQKRGGRGRYAIEYGALLLAVVGPANSGGRYIRLLHGPEDPSSWLIPVAGKSCRFTVAGMPGYEVMPYHEVDDQIFTCYPVLG